VAVAAALGRPPPWVVIPVAKGVQFEIRDRFNPQLHSEPRRSKILIGASSVGRERGSKVGSSPPLFSRSSALVKLVARRMLNRDGGLPGRA
jgi:hypothetical protein